MVTEGCQKPEGKVGVNVCLGMNSPVSVCSEGAGLLGTWHTASADDPSLESRDKKAIRAF